MPDEAAVIEAAHARLRGHLVETPLIGGVRLPGFGCPAALRIKPESLQTGGSIWFRGAMHCLARQLGGLKGLAIEGARRPLLAAAAAAALQRIPTVAILTNAQADPATRALLELGGAELLEVPDAAAARERADELRRQQGFLRMPLPDAEDYALGLATVGLELARDLSTDCETVLVCPASLAEPIGRGLAAGGRQLEVAGVEAPDRAGAELERLALALRLGARLDCDAPCLAGLHEALSGRYGDSPCVVLAC